MNFSPQFGAFYRFDRVDNNYKHVESDKIEDHVTLQKGDLDNFQLLDKLRIDFYLDQNRSFTVKQRPPSKVIPLQTVCFTKVNKEKSPTTGSLVIDYLSLKNMSFKTVIDSVVLALVKRSLQNKSVSIPTVLSLFNEQPIA